MLKNIIFEIKNRPGLKEVLFLIFFIGIFYALGILNMLN